MGNGDSSITGQLADEVMTDIDVFRFIVDGSFIAKEYTTLVVIRQGKMNGKTDVWLEDEMFKEPTQPKPVLRTVTDGHVLSFSRGERDRGLAATFPGDKGTFDKENKNSGLAPSVQIPGVVSVRVAFNQPTLPFS